MPDQLIDYPPAYTDHLLSSGRRGINIGIEGKKVDQKEKHKYLLPCCHQSSHYGDKGVLCLLKREEMTEVMRERERDRETNMQAPGRKIDSRGELFCWEQLHLMYLVIKTSVSHGVGGRGNDSQTKCIMQKDGADQSCGEMACLERMNMLTFYLHVWFHFKGRTFAGKNKMEKEHWAKTKGDESTINILFLG